MRTFNRFLVIMLIILVAIFGWLIYSLDRVAEEGVTNDIGMSLSCERIGPADSDPIIANLQELGYDIDYLSGLWIFEGEVVGHANAEDEGFAFCADPITLQPVSDERAEIIASGGYGN